MTDIIYLKGSFAYREDTLENWEASDPVLGRGEPAIVRDGEAGRWLKIGDGVNSFNTLPWKQGPKGEKGYTPVKGTDYFTEADKKELIAEAVAVLEERYGLSQRI